MNKQNDCLFCNMVSGNIAYFEIYQDENYLAFLTIFPNTEGVTVVIPKNHYGSSAFEQSDEVLKNLIVVTKKVAQILTNYFEDVGRCGMVFEGFGINHLHAKLYPLHGTNKKWEPLSDDKKKKTYYQEYPGYISSNDSHQADSQQLAELAKKIRESQN